MTSPADASTPTATHADVELYASALRALCGFLAAARALEARNASLGRELLDAARESIAACSGGGAPS